MIHNNVKICIVENYDEMSAECAKIIAAQVYKKPDSVLGLATGGTPEGSYKEIIKMFREKKVDFSKIKTFNLDEYYPLARESNQSYYYYMFDKLFTHININKDNVNVPNGSVTDTDAECTEYEKKIVNAGGIDLQLLGIGVNGHIGFNEPDKVFSKMTSVVDLTKSTIDANSINFASEKDVPRKAISMGIQTIMMAKKIVLIASGEKKAEAIYQSIMGPIHPEMPGSALQLHRDVTIIVDKAAAKKLV